MGGWAGRGGQVGGHWIRRSDRGRACPMSSVEQTEYGSTVGSSGQLQALVRRGMGQGEDTCQPMMGPAHWGLEPQRLCSHGWRCHLKQREQGVNTLASFFLLPSSLAESARSHLTEELGKCSLAIKVSPSVLQSRVGEEQAIGLKENSPRICRTNVGMLRDHCPISGPRLSRRQTLHGNASRDG